MLSIYKSDLKFFFVIFLLLILKLYEERMKLSLCLQEGSYLIPRFTTNEWLVNFLKSILKSTE